MAAIPALRFTPNVGQARDAVFPGDGSCALNSDHVHDPTVVQVRGRWFCLSTSADGLGTLRSSTDLESWTIHGPLLSEHPEWLMARYKHRSVWAPDIVVLGSTLRVYYCASNWGTSESVIGLAECLDFNPLRPTEGWTDRGMVIESRPNRDPFNAIDAEVLVDEENRHWMFFGSYFGGIFVAELDPETGMRRDDVITLVARNAEDRENALEGAAVCFRDGYYYLFVSYGLAAQGVRSTYRIMVGRSTSPTGPFVGADGKDMVDGGHVKVLKTSPPMFSPGHCDVMQDDAGRWLMPYHFYDGRRFWMDGKWGMPTLQIRELLWSKDGWPLPGLPVEAEKPRPRPEIIGSWLHQADFTEPETIQLHSNGTIESKTPGARWARNEDQLVLQWPKNDAPGQFWVDKLVLAYGDSYYVGRNSSGMVIRAVRCEGD